MEVFKTYADRCKEAKDILVELGVMAYVKDIETYHGRAGDGNIWKVDPNFDNAGNSTGNHNVNKINGLNTADEYTAKKFASARRYSKTQTEEVHKIIAQSDDMVIIIEDFKFSKLSHEQRKKFNYAMDILTEFPLTQMTPIPFEYREIYREIKDVLKSNYIKISSGIYTDEQMTNVIDELSVRQDIRTVFKSKNNLKEFITDLLCSHNSKRLMRFAPMQQISRFISGKNSIAVVMNNEDKEIKISSKYISAWCKANGIIGSKRLIDSATLDETIDVVTYFDTQKIETESQQGERLEHMNRLFSGLTLNLSNFIQDEEIDTFLQKATASEVMQFISQDHECAELFAKDSGVWEKYTVGQHTEAVLDFLDMYKSNEIPVNLRPFIRVAILAHDIGKGVRLADKYGKILNQKDSSKIMAKNLYNALNIDEKYRNIIDFVFGEGQEFTSEYYFGNTKSLSLDLVEKQKDNVSYRMEKSCKDILVQNLGINPTMEEIFALKKICIILQQCDSGAYTRYAKIKSDNKTYHIGGSDKFTKSFVIGKNGMPRLKTYQDESYNA